MAKEEKYNTKNLEKLREALKQQEQMLAMHCNHQKKNGDLNVKWIDEASGTVECKTCGDRFSMNLFEEKDAQKAIFMVHSMIQQMRAVTNREEADIVEKYGKIDFALLQVPGKYQDMVDALARGKKKKKKGGKGKGGNSIGGYGDALAVVRKNKGRRN